MRLALARLFLCVLGIVPGVALAALVALMAALGPGPRNQGWLLPLVGSMGGLLIARIKERGSIKITLACFLATGVSILGMWWTNFR